MCSRPGWAAASVLLAIPLGAVSPAHSAARPAAVHALSIPSQPLEAALQELARQVGTQVVFLSSLTKDKQAPALSGTYTLEESLSALLESSALRYRRIGTNTVEILARRPRQDRRKALPVGKPAESAPLEEVVIRGVAEGVVATRTETPLRDIPHSVSVVSAVQILEQNLHNLSEALDRTPGITTERDYSLDKNYLTRGFPVSALHVDGSANLMSLAYQPTFFWFPRPDLSQFERIEVLRGADGLFSGNASPGGSINFVRKRPRAEPAVRVTASAGSWNNYRLEVDATGPLAFDGALRARVGGAYADRDFFYDIATHSREKLFASFEYDVTPHTLLTLGGSYQRDRSIPVTLGLPWNDDGTDPHLPRNTALTFDWTYYRTQTRERYLQLQQRFGDEWKLKVGAAQWKGKAEQATAELRPRNDAATGIVYYFSPTAYLSEELGDVDQWATELTLTGAFEVLGKRVEMAVGAEYARARHVSEMASYAFPQTGPRLRLEDLAQALFEDPRLSLLPAGRHASRRLYDDRGGFLALKALLTDAWSVSVGARVGQNRYFGKTRIGSDFVPFGSSWTEPVTTPYAAVMYTVSENYSLYASYADIFQRAESWSISPDGKSTGTLHGVNIETGVKASWRDGALNGTLAAYRLTQNRAPLTSRPPGVTGYLTGVRRSSGVDLELNGMLSPGWLLGTGYSLNDNRKPTAVWQGVRGPIYNASELSGITPKHLLKVWTNGQLPGELNRWSVGADLRAQTSLKIEAGQCNTGGRPGNTCTRHASTLKMPAYAVLDLRAGLRIDETWRVGLSVNNALDKRYFESTSNNNERSADFWYGEPRNYLLKVEAVL